MIGTLPIFWKVIFISIMVLANIIYLFRNTIIKWWRKKKSYINLKEHQLFTESSFITHKIKRISLASDKKTYLYQTILLVKYESIKKYALELINNSDIDGLSNKQFYAIVIKNMTEIVIDYNNTIKMIFGQEVFDLVMSNDEKGFNVIHENSIEYIKYTIDETFISDHIVYSTNEDKLDFLFDLYFIAMKLSMKDVDRVYRNFNGDLDILLKDCKCPL